MTNLNNIDIEVIEKIIFKNGDDISNMIARKCERLEQRIDMIESRLTERILTLSDNAETMRQELVDRLGDIKEEMNILTRTEE
jgi:hypothetical protein